MSGYQKKATFRKKKRYFKDIKNRVRREKLKTKIEKYKAFRVNPLYVSF